jgi:hypothetical protein
MISAVLDEKGEISIEKTRALIEAYEKAAV